MTSLTARTGKGPASVPATLRHVIPRSVVIRTSPLSVPAYTVCEAVAATAAAVKYRARAHIRPLGAFQHRRSLATEGDTATQFSPRLSVRKSFSTVSQIVDELDGSIAMRGMKGPSSDRSMPDRRTRQLPTSHRKNWYPLLPLFKSHWTSARS